MNFKYAVNRAAFVFSIFLAAATAAPGISLAQSTPSAVPLTLTQNHQLWDTGSDIQSLQQWLNANGFPVAQTGAGSPGSETTTFGTHTYQALIGFQRSEGLPATGFLGPLTRGKLAQNFTSTTSAASSSTSATSATTTTPSNCPASSTLTCYPGTAIVRPVAPGNGYTPGFGGGGTTVVQDITPPVISSVSSFPTAGDGTQAVISWSTDEPATSQVQYGTNAGAYTNSSSLDATPSTKHSVTLTGLTASTTYFYQVKSADVSGNLAASDERDFASAIPLPSLPLANGAKVVGFGHSFIARSAANRYLASQTATNGLQGLFDTPRGVLNIASAEDGRFNTDIFTDAINPYEAPSTLSALTGSYQGINGDHLYDIGGAPGTINRTPYVLSQQPQIVYLDVGTNDIDSGVGGPFGNDNSAASVISALDTQINLLTRAGVWVVLQTIAFRLDWYNASPNDPRLATLDTVNAWIKLQAGRAGVQVMDTTAIDGTSAVTEAALPNVNGLLEKDGVHPTPLLSSERAAILLPILQSMVASGDSRNLDPLSSNLFPEAGLPGTSGTKVSTAPSFTGSMSGTTLTVTSVPTNGVVLGAVLTGTGITAGTTVVSQLTSTETTDVTGARGTYQVSASQTVASETMAQTISAINITGMVAASTTLTRSAGTSAIAASKEVVSVGDEKQVITVTPVNDGIPIHSAKITFPDITLASMNVSPGDWVEADLPVEVDDWAGWGFYTNTAVSPVTFNNEVYSSTNQLVWVADDSASTRNGTFVLHVKIQIPTGVDANKLRYSSRPIVISWLSTASGSGTVKIGSPILRKITDPRSVWNLP
jgi:peptidoglycan hydrolase-like protein with peptidoglycan-binding domain